MEVYKSKTTATFGSNWSFLTIESWSNTEAKTQYIVIMDNAMLRVTNTGEITALSYEPTSQYRDSVLSYCLPSNKLELLVVHGITESDIEGYLDDAYSQE